MNPVKQIIKMAFQNLILPVIYRISCMKPVDPKLVVFADAHHNERPDNMQLLISACEKGPWTVREIYLDYQKNSPLAVLKSMAAFMKLYARAGYVVICDNFLPAAGCRKRPQTKVIQLWHACGSLKRFGYDTTDDIPASYRGHVFRNTDLVTVSAPWCEARFASAMRLSKDHVSALGVSRTDRYFDPAWTEEARRKFVDVFPDAAGKKIALWAPTFRGSAGAPQSIPFDAHALEQALGSDWRVIVSTHPHMKDGRVLITTEELFVTADCLIADYSSLIYEYILMLQILGRSGSRVVLYTPDFEEYVSKRGFYMPYTDIPGTQVSRFEDLAGAVRAAVEEECTAEADGKNCAAERAEQKDRASVTGGAMTREAFLKKYMSACDGRSTQRILDWMKQNRTRHRN